MERHIIIGSGSGIGAALARRLAGPGTALLLHSGRSGERLDGVAEACRAVGSEVDTCLGLTGEDALFQDVAKWLRGLPEAGLTGLTFAAGYAHPGTLDDTGHAALRAAFETMPVAFQRLAALASTKLADERGRILCVSAFGAHRTRTHSYAASAPAKAALEAQVRVFAANLAPRGISVNAVVPGFIAKDPGRSSTMSEQQWCDVKALIPMDRLGQPDEVAALGQFLLSPAAGYITGQCLHISGGLTL